MNEDKVEGLETEVSEKTTVDWAELRAQATKLGISLSQLQQQQREQKLRMAKKAQSRAANITPPTE